MQYLLDTNTCIYIIKRCSGPVMQGFKKLQAGDVGIPAVTACELRFGVFRSVQPGQNLRVPNEFRGPLEVLDFPAAASAVYGRIRALDANLILPANNVCEFARAPDFRAEHRVG